MSAVTKLTPIVQVQDLIMDFRVHHQHGNASHMRALNKVSFDLYPGRAFAIVGESGSGKSTSARIMAKMHNATAGQVRFEGNDIRAFQSRKALLDYRAAVQMIWQDPFSSLNPTHTIFHHIARPLLLHRKVRNGTEARLRVHELLEQVGLTPAQSTASKYPHQLSGGQRQRVNLARTLAVGARVVLADEPTSMLDVSIRAGVLNLLQQMKQRENMALLYITHDIATARYLAEEMGVMYVGHMVEWGNTEAIIQHPRHPYTQLLISAVPNPSNRIQNHLDTQKGEIPIWTSDSKGCPFYGRCHLAKDQCKQALPEVKQLAENHFIRCHEVQ